MNWFPEGWNRFLFLVTPEEQEELFSGFHQVTFCRRVPRGYRESPAETLLAPWRALWEKLPGPEPPDLKRDRNCFDWADGLTHDLTRCRYAAPFQDKATGEWFQLADFDEPCVGVQPFALVLGEDGKLYTRFHYGQFPRLIAGLELQYPKKAAYFNKTRDGYERIVPCGEIETYCRVYQPLTQRIKAITKPLTFSIGGKTFRPGIRISPKAREAFPGFWFAREYDIRF